jgi:hypothetical protein
MRYLPIIYLVFLLTGCQKDKNDFPADRKVARSHSLSEELRVFHDISSIPSFLDSTFTSQVSSYDTTWNNDDGFSGRYSFIRRNEDSTLVIFEKKGKGVITRIWTPTPTEDTLDFYIDNDNHPAMSIKYSDLFSGKRYPFVAPLCGNQLGGFYCYLPIPFAESCRIVSRGKKLQFHQLQYRIYSDQATVKSFSPDLTSEEKETLERIQTLWNKKDKSPEDFYSEKLSESAGAFELHPGDVKEVLNIDRPGRLAGIEFGPVSAFEGLSKNLAIRITWDNESTPSVYCPVADFFGYAFGQASMQSLLVGSTAEKNYCYFPMPFDNNAKIELIYLQEAGKGPLTVTSRVWYSENGRDKVTEGKFYSHWNKVTKAVRGEPHIFLDVKGRGHYVGTILQAQGMKAGMTYFFEGDDSTNIDGDFRLHGTGSEDYFNGGWYAMMDRWEGKMSLPLHGALDYSLPFCRTGGYRLFLSDKIPYEKSFYHSIEHGPVRNQFPVDYTSLGLYYADRPGEKAIQPTKDLVRVFVPDTLVVYPQLMDYNIFGGIDVKTTWKYGTGGETYFFTPGADSWLRISLEDIPYGSYSLYFDVMKEPFGCDFSLWQRQTAVSDWISTYSKDEERKFDLYVGDIDVEDFKNTVTLRFRPQGQKKTMALNRVMLIRNHHLVALRGK